MFEAAQEGLQKAIEGKESQGDQLESKESNDLAPDTASEQKQELIDLDKLEKFRFEGKDWTLNDLRKSYLMHSDYTRKTMELSQERKFSENLAYDIANVLRNPQLVDKFKQTYPEKFHRYLDAYGDFMNRQSEETQPEKTQQPAVDPSFLKEFNEMKNEFNSIKEQKQAQELRAAEAELDNVFSTNLKKYPSADETVVTNKALALLEQLKERGEPEQLTAKQWDLLFKSEHERVRGVLDKVKREEAQQQIKSNRLAKEAAPGGGTPGQAPAKRTFKEATEDAIKHFASR